MDLGVIQWCIEDWAHPVARIVYSICSMVFIYLIPITTVSLAYKKICVKLRNRLGAKISSRTSTSRKAVRIIDTSRIIDNTHGISWAH
jgi:hypothetical protein